MPTWCAEHTQTKEPLPEVIDLTKNDPNVPEEESSSLGVQWHIKQDTFSIKTVYKDRPKTKAGVLGHIMAVYDPIGISGPAMLSCKLFQRDLIPRNTDEDPHRTHALGWHDPLPTVFHKQWSIMLATCQEVSSSNLCIPRPFYPQGHGAPIQQQLFAFADASDLALCHVIYLRTITADNTIHVAFVRGSANMLPKGVSIKGQLSIPRAELNAAVDLAEKALEVEMELDIADLKPTVFYSDSEDVLSWIKNDTPKEPL